MPSIEEFELIIVGGGAAGLAAAVSYIERSRQLGRMPRLALLETAPRAERGGATRWTTARFRALEDLSLDPFFVGRMQELSGGLADAEYCRRLEAETPATLRFLQAHGVELVHYGPPVAMRVTHEVTPNGGGAAIVEALAKHLEDEPGVHYLYETTAERLVIEDGGSVAGVVVRGTDGRTRTLAAGSVLLACGGFEGNREMLTRYAGANAVDLPLLAPGLRYNQGAGIKMAVEAGAATAGQFDMIHTELVDTRTDRADAVIYAHPYGIVVNGNARRFWDEGQGTFEDTFEHIAFEVWKNQRQTAFYIGDQTVTQHPGVMVLFDTDKPAVTADTVEQLAALLGLEPADLRATVDEYNAAVQPGEFNPNVFDGKTTQGLSPDKTNWAFPLVNPPYFAYPLTAAVCFTYGGLRADSEARVLAANGAPIPGLYAAGEIVGLFYHSYPAGTSVLRSLTFGRIAGTNAADAAA
jgi:tricarballylate dehydrogenase